MLWMNSFWTSACANWMSEIPTHLLVVYDWYMIHHLITSKWINSKRFLFPSDNLCEVENWFATLGMWMKEKWCHKKEFSWWCHEWIFFSCSRNGNFSLYLVSIFCSFGSNKLWHIQSARKWLNNVQWERCFRIGSKLHNSNILHENGCWNNCEVKQIVTICSCVMENDIQSNGQLAVCDIVTFQWMEIMYLQGDVSDFHLLPLFQRQTHCSLQGISHIQRHGHLPFCESSTCRKSHQTLIQWQTLVIGGFTTKIKKKKWRRTNFTTAKPKIHHGSWNTVSVWLT